MNIANMSITEIHKQLELLTEVSDELIAQLQADRRKGVNQLAAQLLQRAKQRQELADKWERMNLHERTLRQQGKQVIVGIDEVGRGPLAGPVVACAVALPETFVLPGLDDSKKLTEEKRKHFCEQIKQAALGVGVGIVEPARIDQINILEATREAMRMAISSLTVDIDVCLIDAVHLPDLPHEQMSIIGGDAASVSIAAASVVAKVTRDAMMAEYAREYPEYGFEKNAGYGTKEHLQAIEKHGPTPIHRFSFTGVKEWV